MKIKNIALQNEDIYNVTNNIYYYPINVPKSNPSWPFS